MFIPRPPTNDTAARQITRQIADALIDMAAFGIGAREEELRMAGFTRHAITTCAPAARRLVKTEVDKFTQQVFGSPAPASGPSLPVRTGQPPLESLSQVNREKRRLARLGHPLKTERSLARAAVDRNAAAITRLETGLANKQ